MPSVGKVQPITPRGFEQLDVFFPWPGCHGDSASHVRVIDFTVAHKGMKQLYNGMCMWLAKTVKLVCLLSSSVISLSGHTS